MTSANPPAEYETNLVNLIHDIRAEFGVPSLPVAIGNTGMANASGDQLLICAAQAAVANPALHPEFAGTVFTVDTRPFDYGQLLGMGTEGYHWYWNAESYFNIGESMGLGMMSLLSSPPAVTNAPATSITTTSAVLNATVAWPYTPCNASAWWNTVNGGTNPAAWVNSAAAGSWANTTRTNQYGLPGDYVLAGGTPANVVSTNLSYPLTGLAPDTTYYFTFCATNRTVSNLSATNVLILWATNVQSFTTLASAPPIPVLPASAITMSERRAELHLRHGGRLQVSPRLQERTDGRCLAAGHRAAGLPAAGRLERHLDRCPHVAQRYERRRPAAALLPARSGEPLNATAESNHEAVKHKRNKEC